MRTGDSGKSPEGVRWSTLVVVVAGGASAALGLVVLVGWHTKYVTLLQIHPTFIAMVYNTALSLFLCGVGLLAIAFGRPGLALPCGGVAAAFARGGVMAVPHTN